MADYNTNSPELAPTTQASGDSMPQFATAEYLAPSGTERCGVCSNLLSHQFFVANGQKICPSCAMDARAGTAAGSHAAFVRALLFGIGGAIVGMLLYAVVTIATGWTIGYVALGVGWIVGKAMLAGSNGIAGRRYQIAACALTYAAISLASVVEILYYLARHPGKIANWNAVAGRLLIYGIASPFMGFSRNPATAALGLFILFIGLRIAWTLTRSKPLPMTGPYNLASGGSAI